MDSSRRDPMGYTNIRRAQHRNRKGQPNDRGVTDTIGAPIEAERIKEKEEMDGATAED